MRVAGVGFSGDFRPICRHISTRNTLDCHQSNYSSRIVVPSYLLNLAKPEVALFDPPTSKIPS